MAVLGVDFYWGEGREESITAAEKKFLNYIRLMYHFDIMKDLTPKDLKSRRAALGLSQTGLAGQLARSLPTIQRWETGKTPIPLEVDAALNALEFLNPLERLKDAVFRAENESRQDAVLVQIPIRLAREFLSWGPDEWEEHLGGWMSRKECRKAADDCFREGEKALERLKLGLVRITVAKDIKDDVGEVTILRGRPRTE